MTITNKLIKCGIGIASKATPIKIAKKAVGITGSLKNTLSVSRQTVKTYNLANDTTSRLFSNDLDGFEKINHSHAKEARLEYYEARFTPVHKFFTDIIEREKVKEQWDIVDVDYSITEPILTVQENIPGAFEKKASIKEQLNEAINGYNQTEEAVEAKIEVAPSKGGFG